MTRSYVIDDTLFGTSVIFSLIASVKPWCWTSTLALWERPGRFLSREQTMMTSSNGNIFRVTGPLCGEFTGPGEFLAQRPVTWSFDVFFDLRLNKRLSKQSWGWWFETLSRPLWRHCNGYLAYSVTCGIATLARRLRWSPPHAPLRTELWWSCAQYQLPCHIPGI